MTQLATIEVENGISEIATSNATSDLMQQLEDAVYSHDNRTFAQLVEGTDWSKHTPDDLFQAISLSLSLDLSRLSIAMAKQGIELFPDDENLQRAQRILAPVKPARVMKRTGPPSRDPDASWKWLYDHEYEYCGQWVAVNRGRLLGVAPSLSELRECMEHPAPEDAHSTFFHHYPS